MLDHDEIVRLYGPWRSRSPKDVAEVFNGYDGLWWIAGGWAIEAFTRVSRSHGDVDASIPRADVSGLRRHLRGRLDVWQADDGVMIPMVHETDEITETCENLWLRPSGADPWEFEVILMHIKGDSWTYKRDDRINPPIDAILWERDGIRYLRPEIQLLHKAPRLRPKDQADFEACVRGSPRASEPRLASDGPQHCPSQPSVALSPVGARAGTSGRNAIRIRRVSRRFGSPHLNAPRRASTLT